MALGTETYNANLPKGDIDDFLNDMSEEKASYSQSEDEGLDEIFSGSEQEEEYDDSDNGYTGDEYDDSEGDEEQQEFNPQFAELSAEFAAMMTDLALPSLIAMFIKCNPEKLQATKEQYAKLTTAYAQYLRTKQIALSPGWLLIGSIVSIYATKIPNAMQEQKLKDKEEELKAKEAELEKRMQEYERSKAETYADRSDE